MRALVTGGSGFIGSHLCDALVARGHEVVCVDNLLTGRIGNVKGLLGHERFRFVREDACDPSPFEADAVFHLASPTAPEDSRRYGHETVAVNTTGTRALIRAARTQGAKFLFASSVKVLGDCQRVRDYIAGKKHGEKLCAGSGAKIARLGSVYGPRMRSDDSRVIPVFIRRALRGEILSLWNGGRQMDSFCYVSDIVEGLIRFMESDEAGLMEFGYPKGISILDLAARILELTGSRSVLRTDERILVVDECHKVPDIARARASLGWEPRTGLTEGLKRTIEEFAERIHVAEENQENDLHPGGERLGSGNHLSDFPADQAVCG